jgi:flagellar hook-basal body protein
MDPLTTSAANGMRARLESLDLLANNIANSSAPGFKADREFFGTYLSEEAAESPDGTNPPILPVIERNWTDFAQGSMTPTGGPLDVALNGKGFFVATSPSGSVFTRDGSFRLSKDGQLETLAENLSFWINRSRSTLALTARSGKAGKTSGRLPSSIFKIRQRRSLSAAATIFVWMFLT